ncbi:MAG TPA: hypothetical protein ENK55_09515, partial [Actinobacteria bacterium]|nr:hypothetical protein [Actinomycetota bacterium]
MAPIPQRRALPTLVLWTALAWLLTAGGASAADGVGLVDPETGRWHLRDAAGATSSFYYGDPGDVPFVGDWDCDGIDT